MKFEKSCGAIVYRKTQNQIDLLLIKNRYGGHWSFPKGHVEGAETEMQTALREVKEETGLDISIQDGFRQAVEYFPKPNVRNRLFIFWEKRRAWNLRCRKRRSAALSGPISARLTTWLPLKMIKT